MNLVPFRRRLQPRIPAKNRRPLRAFIYPPITHQVLQHLALLTLPLRASIVVDIDTLAPTAVVFANNLRRSTNSQLAPVVFIPRLLCARDDDIRAELCDVHILAFRQPVVDIVH
jgi:hypothetical protein